MAGRIIQHPSGDRHVGGRTACTLEQLANAVLLGDHLDEGAADGYPASVTCPASADGALHRMYRNDALGCCTLAGVAHLQGVCSAWAGAAPAIEWTDEEIVAGYSLCGGYSPSDPTTDKGCNEVDVLTSWQAGGLPIGGDRCAGFVLCNAKDTNEIKWAVAMFGGVYCGGCIPDAWTQVSGDGFVWDDAPPVEANGHCWIITGYDADGFDVVSWGMKGRLTNAGFARIVANDPNGQAWAILSVDIINPATGKAPDGLNIVSLGQRFAALAAPVV